MSWIIAIALWTDAWSDENTVTRPSSSMSILVPVCSWIPRTTLPPGPMISRIFSWRILIVTKRGAYGLSSGRASDLLLADLDRDEARRVRAELGTRCLDRL